MERINNLQLCRCLHPTETLFLLHGKINITIALSIFNTNTAQCTKNFSTANNTGLASRMTNADTILRNNEYHIDQASIKSLTRENNVRRLRQSEFSHN